MLRWKTKILLAKLARRYRVDLTPKIRKFTKVSALTCPLCEHTVYSRARHDMNACPCGAYAIDGGFDYLKVSFPADVEPPNIFELEIEASRRELYDDWNRRKNDFGTLTAEEVEKLRNEG